jgi:hypothetical protein
MDGRGAGRCWLEGGRPSSASCPSPPPQHLVPRHATDSVPQRTMDASTSTATPVHETMPDDTPASSFTADPRVHFDTRSGKWTFEADDGNEMEWEVGRGVWVPVVRPISLV